MRPARNDNRIRQVDGRRHLLVAARLGMVRHLDADFGENFIRCTRREDLRRGGTPFLGDLDRRVLTSAADLAVAGVVWVRNAKLKPEDLDPFDAPLRVDRVVLELTLLVAFDRYAGLVRHDPGSPRRRAQPGCRTCLCGTPAWPALSIKGQIPPFRPSLAISGRAKLQAGGRPWRSAPGPSPSHAARLPLLRPLARSRG